MKKVRASGSGCGCVAYVIAGILGGVSLLLGSCANRAMREKVRIERTPVSRALALLEGPAAVRGTVTAGERILKGPFTGEPCVYFRKLVEEERRDSDGDTYWATVEDIKQSVPFLVRDATGQVPVVPEGAEFRARRVHFREFGGTRSSEYAVRPGDSVFLFGSFDGKSLRKAADTPLIVAAMGEEELQTARGVGAFLFCLAGFACATLAVFTACCGAGVHRVFVYLLLIGATVPAWLFIQWLLLTRAELLESERALSRAQEAVAEARDPLRSGLLKQTFNDGAARHNAYRGRFPNILVAWVCGVRRFEPMRLSPAERERIARFPLPVRKTGKLGVLWGLGGLVAGGALLFFFSFLGFKKLRVKRLIENLPTTPTTGVVIGLTELKGTARRAEKVLKARYTKQPCLWYRYRMEKRRGSGKDAKWVTVEKGEVGLPFWLEDQEGRILVRPYGATVTAPETLDEEERNVWRREWRIDDGLELYVLGPARLWSPNDKALSIARSKEDPTYIITNEPEEQLKLAKAWGGFFLLNLSLIGGTGAVLALLGLRGFTAFDLFLAGLFPILYLSGLVALFIRNDLVWVRQRMERALAMIDVALKKRADLVPNLVASVRAYLAHEKGLHERIAAMRAVSSGTMEERERTSIRQREGAGAFLSAVEKYPALKGSPMVLDLQKRLVQIENEIAFARSAYNDAVERYNTRIQSFPEVVFALWMRLRPARPFEAGRSERGAPAVRA